MPKYKRDNSRTVKHREKTKRLIQHIIYYTSLGWTKEQIAAKLGYSVCYIDRLKGMAFFWQEVERVNHKLPNPVVKRKDAYTEQEIAKLRDLHRQGLTNYAISQVLKRSHTSVERHLKKLNLTPNTSHRTGHNVFTEEEKEKMIHLRLVERLSYEEIAEKMNRSYSGVYLCLVRMLGKTPRSDSKEYVSPFIDIQRQEGGNIDGRETQENPDHTHEV